MITSHAVTMLLLHQCLIYTHFGRDYDEKTGDYGLSREPISEKAQKVITR